MLSRAQLRGAGLAQHAVDREIDVGRWRAATPGVVVLHNGPLDRRQVEWVGVLHAGDRATLSHLTACESAGLRWTRDDLVHVLGPKGDLPTPVPGVRFHQTRRRYDGWVIRGEGPPRLGIEHAVLLTAERERNLRKAIGLLAAAVQQRLTDPDKLALAITQIRKLRNKQPFQLHLGDIAGGAESFAEIDVVRLCVEAGLAPPLRQTRRRDKEGRWRYLDLEWMLPDGRRLVLEVDGSFHLRVEHWSADMRRERAVVLSGTVVLRCSSMELRLDPSDILEDLVAAGVPRFVCDHPA